MTELKASPAARKKAILAAGAALLVLALAAALLFGLRGNTEEPDAGADAAGRVYTVRTIQVSPTAGDVALRYTGLVQPADLVQVTAGTIGRVEKIYVAEGDAVTAGQLLAQLDDSDAVRQAENFKQVRDTAARALESAQRSHDRALKDYQDALGGAPAGDLNTARDRLNSAKERESTAQKEADRIDRALEPQQRTAEEADRAYQDAQRAYGVAKEEYETAETEYNQAKEAAEADPENTELEDLLKEAEEKKDKKSEVKTACEEEQERAFGELLEAQTALTEEQTRLGYAAAQTELTAAQSERAAAQAAYDTLSAQGGEDTAAVRAQKERLEAADTALDQARTSYDTAQRNYENALEAIEDCKLRAEQDGYVVTIVSSEGGLATPIAPVLVLGSRSMVAQFGVSQSDVRELSPGMPATVTLDGQVYAGSILSIAVLPDETTRTYPVDVSIGADFSEVYLGSMASVELQLGQRVGVWLPLPVILNDGEDYVYMVEEGRAVRRNVEILELSNDMVLVSGVHEGGQVISEGMKNVRSGSPVHLLGGEG